MFNLQLCPISLIPAISSILQNEIVTIKSSKEFSDKWEVMSIGLDNSRLTRMEALFNNKHLPAGVAQLVEHGTENPGVPSSILGPGTFYF